MGSVSTRSALLAGLGLFLCVSAPWAADTVKFGPFSPKVAINGVPLHVQASVDAGLTTVGGRLNGNGSLSVNGRTDELLADAMAAAGTVLPHTFEKNFYSLISIDFCLLDLRDPHVRVVEAQLEVTITLVAIWRACPTHGEDPGELDSARVTMLFASANDDAHRLQLKLSKDPIINAGPFRSTFLNWLGGPGRARKSINEALGACVGIVKHGSAPGPKPCAVNLDVDGLDAAFQGANFSVGGDRIAFRINVDAHMDAANATSTLQDAFNKNVKPIDVKLKLD